MLIICNVKLSSKLKVEEQNFHNFQTDNSLRNISTNPSRNIFIYNNFLVLKDKFTYILFKPKREEDICHLNITKIKNFEYINEAIELGETLFQGRILKNSINIDNITATFNLQKSINLKKFYEKYSKEYSIRYNNERFPGLHFKNKKGTLIIFHTGKITVVGCKSKENLIYLQNLLWKLTANMNL